MTNKPIAVSQILDNIKEMLNEADDILREYPHFGIEYGTPEKVVESFIEGSFIKTLYLFEKLKLNKTYEQLNNVYAKAKKHGLYKKERLGDTSILLWSSELKTYLSLIKPSISDKKKLRPNQKAKIKCREIAEKIWSKDPTITIADMIKRPEIRPHRTKRDGSLYVKKTIHNWIKDLCPDRSQGRRPGT